MTTLATPRRRVAAALAAALALAGCANYRIGTTLPPELKTVAVPTFGNESGQPDLESAVTRAVLQEFRRDGTLAVADADRADITVTGKLVTYRLDPITYDRDSRLAAQQYRLVLRAAVQARAGEKTLVDSVLEGTATFNGSGDLNTAKRTALPDAARDLAHEVVNAVVSAWY